MKNRLRDNLIVWGAMLVMVGFIIWVSYLVIQGIDWVSERVSELKAAYFTPLVPELAVTACALLCLVYLFFLLWLSDKAKERHPAAAIFCAYCDMLIVVFCWTIYLLSTQHIDFSLIVRWFVWLMTLGIIGGRLEKDCKIAHLAFLLLFPISLNEYFGTFPLLSMTGVKPEEKDFLEHYFGLTQLIMLSHAALLLATPSSFKWIWVDAKKARDEWIRKILGPLEEAAALDNVPKTEDDSSSKQKPNSSP